MADLGSATSLLSELQLEPRVKANNVVKLIALLSSSKQEAALKAVIQGLKLHFVSASHDGDMSSSAKRQRVDGAQPAAADGSASTSHIGSSKAEDVYRDWLRRQYDAFTGKLQDMMTSPSCSASVQVSSAACLMECVRSEEGPGTFTLGLYARLLQAALCSAGTRPEVLSLLVTKYMGMADVRYYTLVVLKLILPGHASRRPPSHSAQAAAVESSADAADPGAGTEASVEASILPSTSTSSSSASTSAQQLLVADICRNVLDVLQALPESISQDVTALTSWCGAAEVGLVRAAPDKSESARSRRKRQAQEQAQTQAGGVKAAAATAAAEQKAAWANAKNQRRAFGDAWLTFLRLPLPSDVLKRVLVRLPSSIIPHMSSPLLLSDFLTYTLGRGGLLGILALNGLFVLVTRHGLEYPAFYKRLYGLLAPDAFAARHRAQFFRLVDIFLASTLVPAYTVAAFVKRFARLSLSAPPAGALIAIAFMHNLIRRHPSLMVLLHKPTVPSEGNGGTDAAAACLGNDVYLPEEEDPVLSRAVESSLWEMTALQTHYCPQVSTLAAVLDKDLSKRIKTAEVDTEPLLTASYTTLMAAELARRIKQVPTAFYAEAPTRLFDINAEADWCGWHLGCEQESSGAAATAP